MPDNVVTLPLRGKTYLSGANRTPDSTATTSKAIEGIVKTFKDVDYSGTAASKLPRTGGEVICRLVRNASGISLQPGRAVVWKSTKQGQQVDGYCSTDYQGVAGIVDEFLPSAGVANNDLFWLVVRGPCLCKKGADTNTLNKDDYVLALTANGSTNTTAAGRIQSFAGTSNATNAVSEALNRIGIAMSTSNTSGANILVFVDLI